MLRAVDVTRQELTGALSRAMTGGPTTDGLPFQVRSGPVRTIAIEVNQGTGEREPLDQLIRYAERDGLNVVRTADAALAVVTADDGARTAFVDVVDPRFWLIHVAGPSAWMEGFVHRLATRGTEVDWCWFPVSTVKVIESEGRTRWFKSDFRGDDLLPAVGIPARRLKVQLEGDDAQRLYKLLEDRAEYRQAAALTGVAIQIGHPGFGNVIEAAHYRGSFTGRGGSFEVHQAFVARVVENYARQVRAAEHDLGLRWHVREEGRGASLEGHVVDIHLERRIEDLQVFAAGLFSCKEPFRLWAVPRSVSSEAVTAEVVDLHVGERLRIDILPESLRVYLLAGTCGNTLFRLLTNLQHRYDATAWAASPLAKVA